MAKPRQRIAAPSIGVRLAVKHHLGDETVAPHAFQGPIEVRGIHGNGTAGRLGDVLDQAVPVLDAVSQRDQDQQVARRERKPVGWRSSRHTRMLIVIRLIVK